MIFAGEKFGHPWHGAWSSATGKISTPSGGDIDCPGQPPRVRVQNLPRYVDTAHSGDCFKVAVPGQPAVTTTPEEAAAGKTWLNYGLMSGASHRLLGIELGKDDWIYIAADGSRWRASWSHSPLDLAASTTVNFGLRLRRFGEFAGAAVDLEQTIILSVPLALDRPSPGQSMYPLNGAEAARAHIGIDDIRSDGARALLAVQSELQVDSCPLCGRVIFAIHELRISGTPPSATASVVTVAATSDVHSLTIRHRWQKFQGVQWWQDVEDVYHTWVGNITDVSPNAVAAYMGPAGLATIVPLEGTEDWGDGLPEGAPSAGAQFFPCQARFDYTARTIISARYNAIDERVEKVVGDVIFDNAYSGSVTPIAGADRGWSASGSISGSGSVSLRCIDALTSAVLADLVSYPVSVSASWSSVFPGSGTWSGSYSLNGETTALSVTTTNSPWTFGPEPGIGLVCSSMAKHGEGRAYMYVGGPYEMLFPLRYSNAVVGFGRKTMPLSGISRALLFWSVFGKVWNDSGSIAATGTPTFPVFVSEHPETGLILRAFSPVSWV